MPANPPIQIYTTITSAGCTQAWALLAGRSYRVSGTLADALLETGLAVHNPYARLGHTPPAAGAVKSPKLKAERCLPPRPGGES